MPFAKLQRSVVATPVALALAAALFLSLPAPAAAHCDSLDGPVVAAARAALASGDVTPVLRWVRAEDEPAIRATFAHAVEVRALSDQARELADRHFFETLVRIHRAAEGFPFAGLAPAGAPVAPAVRAADAALASGSADALVNELAAAVAQGVRERFASALAARRHADESVAAGRDFVAAYVDFTHFAERVAAVAAGHGGHDGHGEPVHRAAAGHDQD